MSIDINTLSAKELESLISKAKKRKTTLNKRKPITQVRKKLNLLAKNEGYTIAELFGTGGAAFFPSGVMAQQAALRVWCERAGTRRVALPRPELDAGVKRFIREAKERKPAAKASDTDAAAAEADDAPEKPKRTRKLSPKKEPPDQH